MGVHVLDVLVRPVEAIPEGQGGSSWSEIRMTAAGAAGGTALTLAKLGAEVRAPGAVGTDALGDMLLALLERDGVDTSLLVRRDDVQTSASVLPIRPNGDRPAFHVIGANGTYGADDAPLGEAMRATHLHLGGPEFMGGEAAAGILAHARAHGVIDLGRHARARRSAACSSGSRPALPALDYLLPNDEQVLGLHRGGTTSRTAAGGCSSAGWAALPPRAGARARWWWTPAGRWPCPPSRWRSWTPPGAATPSRPASCAAPALGRDRGDAARMGCATAALVAQGLGTDHGRFTLEDVEVMCAAPG